MPLPAVEMAGFANSKCRPTVSRSIPSSRDMGWRLFATFLRAGLPRPEMVLGAPVGAGPHSPMYGHIAETVRSLLPMMELYGIAQQKKL
jgi:hypothetical protein